MAILEILKYPHPILKKKCEEVGRIDEEVKKLIRDMTETMYQANGIGLAACQVGVPKRVVVVDVSPLDPEKEFFAIVNPEIISEEGEIEHEEGCLSVPEFSEKVKRKEKILLRGLSPGGKSIEVPCEGILAIALQHEIDHINGVLILDRISRLKRELYRNKLKKEKKKEEKD
ncbi:MAG: peptide deformylase [Deltaproteobacteria bacterium]|nr:peptide deformylase [Deltaproteobacteria bacterium]MBM4322025.1 peptide deformylase [Deltaproteobacteria bacterium]